MCLCAASSSHILGAHPHIEKKRATMPMLHNSRDFGVRTLCTITILLLWDRQHSSTARLRHGAEDLHPIEAAAQ